MCDPDLDLPGGVDTLPSDKKCKFYWFSPTEAQEFHKKNQGKTHKGDRTIRLEIAGALFTQCTETNKPPTQFTDYVLVKESNAQPTMTGESW